MLTTGLRRVVLLSLCSLALASCGDDDDMTTIDAAVVVDAQPADAAQGALTVRVANLTGRQGKIVLIGVTPGGAGGATLGGLCISVTASPFSFAEVVKAPGATSDPCTLGAVKSFADGTYSVRAGIYTPGNMTPEACSNAMVTVAGSGDVTLPAFGTCP
ncbi:MAG: hypothetical protein IT370_29590 [Deltaproteobacteria bacterium]|nr:hypothetical protein [Deltaproteobacteria bacterium]